MGNYVRHGALDWRSLEGARASGISFLLANGESGEIIDPSALRTFYTRVFYADQIKSKQPSPRRKTTESR
jgi:hypothetical protein